MATKKKNLKKSAKTAKPTAAAQPQQASAGQQAPQQDPTALSIGDLKNLSTILDVASTRGAFKANEMAGVGFLYNQAMPMGDNTGQPGDGQTGPKRHFKHIGELVDGGAKVVIMYRTVPGEPNNCLVVGTKFLPDQYHNALMKAVESDGGQDADEFADFASRQTFPDGTNMLAMLHNDNYIKKFKSNEIMVTYGNTDEGRILLNKLNEMIAKEKGVSVKDLANDPEAAEKAPAKKVTTKKADAKKTSAKE